MGPQVPPAPSASLRAKGAPLRGRVPPMDYLDNPARRRADRPSDDASANNYGFGQSSTPVCDGMLVMKSVVLEPASELNAVTVAVAVGATVSRV